MERKPGMFRYFSFGLRQDWMELFFSMRIDVLNNSSLGPFQKEALRYYLRDMELIDSKGTTNFFNSALTLYRKEGINSLFLWTVLWNNLPYNAPLFEWWNNKLPGRYSSKEIIASLSEFYGKMNRSVEKAYQSLVSTLERTPIGADLKQGLVQKEGRARVVIKAGNPDLSPFAALYALYKLAEQTQKYQLGLSAIEQSAGSPQKVFAMPTAKVETLLRALWLPDFFQIGSDEEQLVIGLESQKTALDVLEKYIERL